jgi:subtilisin family serine protease
MRRSLLPLFLIFAAAIPVAAQPSAGTTRYIVGTKRAARVTPLRMLRDSDEARVRGVRLFDSSDAFAADLTPSDVATLQRSGDVRFLTPVVERHLIDGTAAVAGPGALAGAAATRAGNGSTYGIAQQVPYGIDLVHAREVWPVTKGKGPVHVVIFDTGVDFNHPELKAAYAGGFNTFAAAEAPVDDNHHGTHVSGIIAAADNGIGVVGVAPGCELWMVKVLDASGHGSDENIVAAIDWTLAKKKDLGGNWIVSMSLGSETSSPAEAEAFAKLVDAGVLPVAAAGNRGLARLDYPAAYPDVFAIGAVDSASELAGFSSGGSGLAVVAPGVDVLSTLPVGSVPASGVSLANGSALAAQSLIGAHLGDLTAPIADCGYGRPEEFPAGMKGKIALMQRGMNLPFGEKVRNALDAGAAGAIIYNYDDSTANNNWTLIRPDCGPDGCVPYPDDVTFNWPVVVAITNADGQKLLALAGGPQVLTISSWNDDYGKMSGTSMATPHVTGVAALLWSITPVATANDVRNAIALTAHDLGLPGKDLQTGFGLMDALAAGRFLNPGAFGLAATPISPAPPARLRPSHP